MKHLTVELGAIDDIVGDRVLQSVEFPQGAALSHLLKSGRISTDISPRIVCTRVGDGIYITGRAMPRDGRYLVIDVEQSKLFEDYDEADSLFLLQKLLRFAKKCWQGISFNFSERFISGSTKGLLFPFRGFKPAPFRVTIEREPWPDRLEKRGDKGKFLLAYKSGHEGADAMREQADLTNFRKAYEGLPNLRLALNSLDDGQSESTAAEVDQLLVAELPAGAFAEGTIYRGFEDWLPLLTAQQRAFVEAPIEGHRIEGAAGTGKTLSLLLKVLTALRQAERLAAPFHAAFVTHSDATKATIEEILDVMDARGFAKRSRAAAEQAVKVCTLSDLCAEQLRQAISDTEFVDRDAMESKGLQLLYVSEALDDAIAADFPVHERLLSREFAQFLKGEDRWAIAQMFQHEISVVIKGRASEDLDKYQKVPSLKYGLPIHNKYDKGLSFIVFRRYQAKLGDVGQFDTDDVVLTTIGQLDTPIWRRRRQREGYDAIFVDETHLFNINELHLFHYFTKREGPYPIVFSVDRSQAVGDRGWTSEDIAKSLVDDDEQMGESQIRTIFRSSVDIVNLAFCIVSSGATLFTNFDNPIQSASSGFTDNEEKLAASPRYLSTINEEAMIEGAFQRAEAMSKDIGCRRSDILIASLDDGIVKSLSEFASSKNKPFTILTKRGDAKAVDAARQSSKFVIGHADYVGGLEFFAVVLVGVDGGRVPPSSAENSESSRNYLSYAAHNRLYVAITRAKYRVEILGEKSRGPSRIIEPAISAGLLTVEDL